MKITFMGAGSTVFARNVIGDCMCAEALRDSTFALYDIDSKRLEESRTILEAMRTHASDITSILDQGLGLYGTERERPFIEENFPTCRNISIDFAVMEKAPNVYVECVDFGWSDLGTWGSLYDNSPKGDGDNVTQSHQALLFNSHRNVVAVGGDKLVVISGLDDYIVADVADALLIVPKAEEQKIRNYVNEVRTSFGDKYL